MSKTERIYMRTTPEKKEFLQRLADSDPKFKGEITTVLDHLITELMKGEEQNE